MTSLRPLHTWKKKQSEKKGEGTKVRNREESSIPRGGATETGTSQDVFLHVVAEDERLSWHKGESQSLRGNGR